MQSFQCRIIAHVKAGKLVGVAAQSLQCRTTAYIQIGQLVIGAPQIFQCRVIAHVKACKLVNGAVQRFQCCEILHAREVGYGGDAWRPEIDLRHHFDFIRCQDIVIRCVKALVNVGAEGHVGEVFLIDLNTCRKSDGCGKGMLAVFTVHIIVIGRCTVSCQEEVIVVSTDFTAGKAAYLCDVNAIVSKTENRCRSDESSQR